MSFYAERRINCCAACSWAARFAQVTCEPFDEPFIHRKGRRLVAGDVVRTMRLVPCPDGTTRHALGVVSVGEDGMKRVWWEDRDAPDPLGLSNGYMTLVREGERRGISGQLGTVEYDRSQEAPGK